MKTLTSHGVGLSLLLLFIVSGFAGLIYQSVWSQYLGLVLGHAAYAQTLVLAIFMGGMAIGAWFVSQRTPSWRRLIYGYAIVEGLIGIVGLSFQGFFEFYTDFSQQIALPAIGEASIAHLYQWITAGLLILPQSLLLGATFPLLSAGYLRVAPREDGQVLGGLYFSNSLGAALGALLTTFLLLPAFGLPGTVMTAGILNILVAVGAWAVSKAMDEGAGTAASAVPAARSEGGIVPNERLRYLTKVMLAATAISGATSFVYELGWIRMLNQALGTTIHSFELMLTAFILGLAFGGLWIRRRSGRIADPIRYVGYAQVLMGIAALMSIPVFAQSFRWVGWLMEALGRTSNGYVLFEIGTAAISLLVMFPAAFFAGMTLPLFTMSLLRAGADERAIGRIYAANTLGAIAGVAVMVHVLVPLMGVKLSVTLAAAVDALLGLYLLHIALAGRRVSRGVYAAAGALAVALVASSLLGRVDPSVQTSGVFRTGRIDTDPSTRVIYLNDGKTATISVSYYEKTSFMKISTNGKPDAAMTPISAFPSSDEVTMLLTGLMPVLAHPDPQEVAIIGWGSGLSTHTLLGSPVPQQVDTIEIEKAMYEGAKLFGERVERAYKDPRSKVRFEDARTFFSTGKRQYDVIVSEPSNPWISGVANLFTQEFYRFLKEHLKDDGVVVQWLQIYETDNNLVSTILAALAQEFPHVQLYLTNETDLLIVGYQEQPEVLIESPWREQILSKELQRVGLGNPDAVELRRIGGSNLIKAYMHMYDPTPHSDYYPTVSLQAPKARFIGKDALFLPWVVTNGMPVLDMLECRQPLPQDAVLGRQLFSTLADARELAVLTKRKMLGEENSSFASVKLGPQITYALDNIQIRPDTSQRMQTWSESVAMLAKLTIGHLAPNDLRNVWIDEAPWIPDDILQRKDAAHVLRAYASAAARDAQGMYQHAQRVLEISDVSFHPQLREQMLIISILGAMASGEMEKAAQLEAKYGDDIQEDLFAIRYLLQIWVKNQLPVCSTSETLH